MSQPHPTIPGVTVEVHSAPGIELRTLRHESGLSLTATCTDRHRLISATGSHELVDISLIDTLVALIRGQAAWLAEQNGGAE